MVDANPLEIVQKLLCNVAQQPDIQRFATLYQELSQRYGKDADALLKSLESGEIYFPVSVFTKELSGLEILVKFLKEHHKLRNVVVAQLLNRSEKTVWQAYHNASKKECDALEISEDSLMVPISIFQNRKLSILEALVYYLKTHFNLRYSEIGELLSRDQRTIWTVFKRGEKKCAA